MAERGASLAGRTTKIDITNVREFVDELCSRENELQKRYNECRSDHLKPNLAENVCEYCFRQLKYKTPETDAILKARKDIPFMLQPLDAPVLMEKSKREIETQKAVDWAYGLEKIAEERRKAKTAR